MNKQRKNLLSRGMAAICVMMITVLFPPGDKAFSQDAVTKLKVVAEQANIRLKPDISSIIIRQVPKGTVLNSTGKEGEWFMVSLPSSEEANVLGYVHESLVEVLEPLPQKKKKPEKKEISLPFRPEPPKAAGPSLPYRFGLTIMGGGSYAAGGDLNPGIQGLTDLYGDIIGLQGEGNIGPVHLGYSLDTELLLPLSSQFSWGIGLEFLQAKNESSVDYQRGSLFHTLRIRPNLSAVPVSLFLSVAPVPELYVRGGISYYFARCSYFYQIQAEDWIREWEGKAHGQGLGLMGGLGFIKNITPFLSFVAEGTGRLAEIEGFTGKGTYKDERGEIMTEEGKLYFIQNQVLEQRIHSTLFIRQTKPNEAGIIEAREAQINFSGFTLRVGLRFYF